MIDTDVEAATPRCLIRSARKGKNTHINYSLSLHLSTRASSALKRLAAFHNSASLRMLRMTVCGETVTPSNNTSFWCLDWFWSKKVERVLRRTEGISKVNRPRLATKIRGSHRRQKLTIKPVIAKQKLPGSEWVLMSSSRAFTNYHWLFEVV
jgi:hypothetical protein